MNSDKLIAQLPYVDPFLFVDKLVEINENGTKGHYTFQKDAFFYQGHFRDFPVTPGVILTECAAQIGVVSFGVYLLSLENDFNKTRPQIALSSTEMEFYQPVFPGEKVVVQSEKIYFRFHKLKCKVKMFKAKGELVCQGTISGMLKKTL